MKYVTTILVRVIAVSQVQEFLLAVRGLFVFFFNDDTRDSTSTTSRCFFDDVVHYAVWTVVNGGN